MCRLTAIPAELLKGCLSLFTLSLHQNPITSSALREMEGFAEFDVRRRSKYSRQVCTSDITEKVVDAPSTA